MCGFTGGRETLDVLEAIRGRRSVRSFDVREVSKNDLEEIIKCGTLAPSAGNIQPWEFIVVRDQKRKSALAEAAFHQSFIAEAPTVVVVLANQSRSSRIYGRRGSEMYSIQDTAAAIQNMLLAVHSKGLGACWVGAFDEAGAADAVQTDDKAKPVAIIPIGFPKYLPVATPRRRLTEVLHEEVYQTQSMS
jgi:nitroreductase